MEAAGPGAQGREPVRELWRWAGVSFSEFSERELALASSLLKYLKQQVQEVMDKRDGWERLIELLDELIEVADSGLATSIIKKLYRSGSL